MKLRRIAAGFYATEDGSYEVCRYESPTGAWWGWSRSGKETNDSFPSKRECVAALAEYIDSEVDRAWDSVRVRGSKRGSDLFTGDQ